MTDEDTFARIAAQIDEFWNERNVALADEFVAEEFVGHMLGDEDLHGRAEYKAWAESVAEMFPDFELAFEPVFTGDDVFCGRWTLSGTHEGEIPSLGVEPTGRSVEFSGLFIDRIEDGRVVEMWHVSDVASLMEQLGEIPA
jgi:predicted ester cyclase